MTPPANTNSELATACIDDNDCAAGLNCIPSTSDDLFGGGPAGGVCTADCTTDADCDEHDSSAVCILVSQDAGHCFPSCTVGAPALGEVKCQNRSTLTCSSSPSGFGSVCLPACGSDLDCGDRLCDLANGVCVDELEGTKEIGEECDVNAAEPECKGGCLELAEGYSICSGLCNFGFGGCGIDPADSVGAGDPLCLPFDGEGSTGDLGFCLQRCDCDGDCNNNISVCNAFEDQATQDAISAAGLCFPDSLEETDGTPIQGIECMVEGDGGAMTPVDGG